MSFRNTLYYPVSGLRTYDPDKALSIIVTIWFAAALLGQLAFAIYIAVRYGLPMINGEYQNINLSGNITGYVKDDLSGNVMLFAHLLPAALMSVSGMLQLIPSTRKRWPTVHRWNGRMFLMLAVTGALTGLYLTWLRGSRLSDLGAIGISINGILIILATLMAWRYALTRNIALHKRWAVHAFFLVNGVWTFRLLLMGWYVVNQGSNGNNNTLDGPVDLFFSFACYLLPMLIAELVFWAQRHRNQTVKWCVAGVMTFGCLATLLGVFANITGSWIPRMVTAFSAFGAVG